MHPAYSVIIFTTASGAGYGLLVWLALAKAFELAPAQRSFAVVAFGLAFVLITAGLLSSTAHLGRPERAWRAFSQWRTSWLSREGVLALATYLPSGFLALGWASLAHQCVALLLVLATIASALMTLFSTGMIYASLRTIRQWHQPLTARRSYLALGLASGAVLHQPPLARHFGRGATLVGLAGARLASPSPACSNGRTGAPSTPRLRTYTVEAATGLGHLGKVRPLEPPHTEPITSCGDGLRGRAQARQGAASGVGIFAYAVPMAISCCPSSPRPPRRSGRRSDLSARRLPCWRWRRGSCWNDGYFCRGRARRHALLRR